MKTYLTHLVALAPLGLAVALALPGDVDAQRRVAPDSLRMIQEIEPLHGPRGTVVTVYTENLPLQAKVHVGVGATRTGFEALAEGEQGMWGRSPGRSRSPRRHRTIARS